EEIIDKDSEKASKITDEEKQMYNEELDNAIQYEQIKYEYPDIELLNEPTSLSNDRRDELRRTAEKLINVLADFGVKAKLLHVTQGPAVTRFEIQPDTGIKLSKIVGLADDIALNLAVQTVLVAPVPGKAAVGVEIPNTKVSMVSVREILDSPEFKDAKSKLTVALGKDIGGNVVVGDISKMPHVLIAGATGSGKSVCINTIVMSILYKAKPDEVKLIMVDPKVVELGVYNGIPHLLIPVVTDPKKAAGALNWAVAEMMRRYDRFKETGVRKIDAYNQLMEQTGGDKMPNLVIIIDELADLMMVAAKEVEDYICRLAQLARAAGIHLIIATQRPSVDVITGLIKANVPSRIAFSVSSQVDSRTILDRGGADKLLGMGDMLYHPMGARNATRVQGAFVSDKEIEKVLSFIKETSGDTHYSEDLAEQIERCATGENGVTPDVEEDGDPLLQEAIALAIELGKISTSMIQRRLGVGYARAGRIVDQMEARGIISCANGSKPRDVLVSHADMAYASSQDDDYDE
ncbi:MAG: DNA translocase FtsK, partial [Clostridia bacterium]|nr:DNA translocase FtsK [Clostridia bacterium]